uniref:Uncharacterized protein n=1 Tax=Romanomermis culicivorax TaxID=13658 RepID=A0A915JXN0_ROMCU
MDRPLLINQRVRQISQRETFLSAVGKATDRRYKTTASPIVHTFIAQIFYIVQSVRNNFFIGVTRAAYITYRPGRAANSIVVASRLSFLAKAYDSFELRATKFPFRDPNERNCKKYRSSIEFSNGKLVDVRRRLVERFDATTTEQCVNGRSANRRDSIRSCCATKLDRADSHGCQKW